MHKMKVVLNVVLTLFSVISCTESKTMHIFSENTNSNYAKSELESALTENEILPDKVISDSETAVEIAEIILFKIYRKENIIKQRPYDVNYIDNYYIINGTLPNDKMGGTFLIVINSKDGKVIKLTHEK